MLMHDIGLVKMFAAGRVLFTLPAGMAAGYGVALIFGLPALVGIMLGALPAFLSCFVVVDSTASRVAARSAALYVPFALALFCSIALREFRVLELVLIILLLFIQFYASRFGVWVGDFGAGLFAAYLVGLLLPLPLTSFPVLALIFAVSLLATVIVRSAIFHPNAYRSLMRSRRAFLAWGTRVLEASADVLDESSRDKRAHVRLRRRRSQYHEAALIADGMLAVPGSGATGETAERLHSLLFDTEQAIDGLARVAHELASAGAPAEVRAGVARAIRLVLERSGGEGHAAATRLLAWADTSPEVVADARWANAVHRTAILLDDIAATADEWRSVRRSLPTSGEGVPFESPVVLFMGRPAGATPILNAELADGGMSGPWRRLKVSPALRTAIQAAVAVAIVEPIALALDGQRFYWGVIGVMVVLAGTNSIHDRVRKTVNRGIGTVIGGAIGIVLVHFVGVTHPWITLVIVVVFLVAGMYGFTRSYAFWVIGLVVVLCQVYNYSGAFSDGLIVYRLVENLLGAVIAVIVSAVILPLATGRMIRRAVIRQLATVRRFLEASRGMGSGPESAAALRRASRAIDQATYQLESVMKPLVRFTSGGGSRRDDRTRTALVGVASTLRGAAYRGERHRPLSDDRATSLSEIVDVLGGSISGLSEAVAASGPGARATPASGAPVPTPVWRSSASLLTALDEQLADSGDDVLLSYRLHALMRVDEAMAGLAPLYGMHVDATAPRTDLVERRAHITAGHVRRRFPAA
ncbi:hypothetical protein AX769_20050 [Frondihabitans sp. PAMC 28766]|nr:hypothetical protein AX769_20050 [Frondihabitans sp. PAMC 28766]